MEFLHKSNASGLSYYSDHDHATDKTVIRSQQDVKPVLDEALERRNSGSGDNKIAGHMSHYAMVPAVVQLELMKKGIHLDRLNDPEQWRRFAFEMETTYKHFKVTDKKVWRPS